MSLILGINLPQYLYLVSDTRLTKLGKKIKYQDNFNKFYCFNENVSVVVAGYASLASYILKRFKKSELVKKGFLEIETGIDKFIKKSIDKYLKEGNKYTTKEGKPKEVVLIFAGFDKSAKKQINASHYGKTLFNTFVPGEKQTLNKEIIREILKAASKNNNGKQKGMIGELKKNQIVEINYPYSSIIAIEIRLPDKLEVKKVGCYKYVMRAPSGLSEDNLPKELAYKLEQEGSKHGSRGDIFKFQSLMIAAWVNEVIEKYKLNRVGGNILVNMITPEGAIIVVGAMNALNKKTKKIKKISEIVVHHDQFCIRNKKGKIIPMKNICDFKEKGMFEL